MNVVYANAEHANTDHVIMYGDSSSSAGGSIYWDPEHTKKITMKDVSLYSLWPTDAFVKYRPIDSDADVIAQVVSIISASKFCMLQTPHIRNTDGVIVRLSWIINE